jgi:hypothetical protein
MICLYVVNKCIRLYTKRARFEHTNAKTHDQSPLY